MKSGRRGRPPRISHPLGGEATDAERAAICLRLLGQIKDAIVAGHPFGGSVVAGLFEDVETELYWIRGPKPRDANGRVVTGS